MESWALNSDLILSRPSAELPVRGASLCLCPSGLVGGRFGRRVGGDRRGQGVRIARSSRPGTRGRIGSYRVPEV